MCARLGERGQIHCWGRSEPISKQLALVCQSGRVAAEAGVEIRAKVEIAEVVGETAGLVLSLGVAPGLGSRPPIPDIMSLITPDQFQTPVPCQAQSQVQGSRY